jgi:hypothetical protein
MVKIWEGPVQLEPVEHVYIHRETGIKYTSVTKVLSSIEPHFDSDAIAEAIVRQADDTKQERYIGMNKVQILDYWQMLNDNANEYGTYVHETIEEYLLNDKWFFPEDPLQKKVIEEYERMNFDEGAVMWPERIMFSSEYELAGTADLIIDIDDVFFDVGDWKTNRVFNFYNDFGFKTLLKPFEHLQDCQYSIYTLQLSTYALMYEMEFPHKKCRQIWIGYWDKETETMSKIPVMYLKGEAKKLLEHHKFQTQLAHG